ncbi:MAG TPA: trigger factor [Elusimicrobiales bacterium]|nr:trigger factor [Elusimicrobiales bacterium]
MPVTLAYGDKIRKIKADGCVHVYAVDSGKEVLAEVQEQALVRLQAVVTLPGFRQGKVPLAMIKEQFPSMVRDEALDILAKAALPEIIKAESAAPVVTPLMTNVKYETGKTAYFEVQLECSPKVEPKNYERIKAVRRVKKVSEDEVDKYINQLREYNAYLKPVEDSPIAGTHFVVVDYETWENGVKVADGDVKGEIVDMSAPQTVAGLAEKLLGARKGDTVEFDSEFGGRKLKFKARVQDVKEKVVPALDEGFLSQAGVKTAEELRGNVRGMLERGETERTEKDLLSQIEDHLIKHNPMSLPPTLVKEESKELMEVLRRRMQGDENFSEEAFAERVAPIAERNLRLTYLLHNIARKEKIEATDADVDAELQKALARLASEEEKNKARELFDRRKDYIRASIVENKTMDFIKSKAEIKEESK